MEKKLKEIKENALKQISKIKNLEALRNYELKLLGRKGELTKLLRGLSDLSVDERKKLGKLANDIKTDLKDNIKSIKNNLDVDSGDKKFTDVTLPGDKLEQGHLNPLTILQHELEDIFTAMGFMVLDGPELESDYYNFEALNIPKYHPARDQQDTFYIDRDDKEDLVLRTQTSSMQVRAMQKFGAPLRCVVPGRVFRYEAIDATHDNTFYQIEGLMIDENISIANLISVLKEVLSGIFHTQATIRVRPGYFPFVEPGLEVDMQCTMCGGKGCSACKHGGWLEMLGSGMVHPNVLKAGNLDPNKYSGFAFGIGLERLAMMKYNINDIRLFRSGDIRFIEQF